MIKKKVNKRAAVVCEVSFWYIANCLVFFFWGGGGSAHFYFL